MTVSTDAKSLSVQIFAYGTTFRPDERDPTTGATAMTPVAHVDWTRNRNAPGRLRVFRVGDWPSGLYYMRLTAGDGRVGYAPFVLRPKSLGTSRIGVVLSTYTWQAYNFTDANGDGWGDSWYVDSSIRHVDLTRPFLDFGVPFRFRDWDLAFIAWLNRTGRSVDYLTDGDLERLQSGDELARSYDLLVFPGHAEYVTAHVYDLVTRYRDLGGNLLFLSANNFFRQVTRSGDRLVLGRLWRNLGRPEAALVGAQYAGSNHGAVLGRFTVTDAAAAPWLFDGTGLSNGGAFGSFGIEIDATAPSSPPGTHVLARIPDVLGPGRTAEMTYYETPAGAKVFDAGAVDFASGLGQPPVDRLIANLWTKLSVP
jgi:hypothetical protein